jgi:DNA-binding NarL/FixJ family response regulator
VKAIHTKNGAEEEVKREVEKQCRSYDITDREQEILTLILSGKEDKEIGPLLNISYHTVRSHIKSIYKKCNVQNKIELLNIFKKRS